MPRDGSGNYSLPSGQPVVTGTTISSTTHNTLMSDVASALTGSLAKNGEAVATGNQPMGGYKHTNVAVAAALTDYARASQVQDGSICYLTSVSGTNTITATAPLSMAAYAAGQALRFIPANTNTGAVTINVNSLGAKAVTKSGAVALEAGDLSTSQIHTIVYDGTRFQLESFVRLKTGFYTGDGSTSQAITGVGFRPKVLIIVLPNSDGSASIFGITTTSFMARDAQGLGLFMSTGAVTNLDNRFISLDSDGFTVSDDGADVFPNTNAQIYDYIAWG